MLQSACKQKRFAFETLSGDEAVSIRYVDPDADGVSIIEDYEMAGHTFDPGRICIIDSFATVAQAFDARVIVRKRDDGPEFRVRGVPEQPDGWHPVP